MKRLRNYVVIMAVAFMPLYSLSCDKDDEKEEPVKDNATNGGNDTTGIDSGVPQSTIGPYMEYASSQLFYDSYNAYIGEKALIDYRSAENYAVGHLSGAVNIPADAVNTLWCQDLLAKYPTTTCLFFYGTGSFEMNKTVAGRASGIGYGKEHSRICSKGYDDLVTIWK